jgi:hypothetical protein
MLHAVYYLVALRIGGFQWRWRDAWGFLVYVGVRLAAALEGILLACRRSGSRWVPTPHKKD